MEVALLIHRLQFAFTATYHYLYPQLTMGLAPLIVILKTLAIRKNDETYNLAARFWARIFGINFAIGVVTGIPMEFSCIRMSNPQRALPCSALQAHLVLNKTKKRA